MTNLSASSGLELVYQERYAVLYQCDATESFVLSLGREQLRFRACELIAFRRRIQQIKLEVLFASHTPDVEIVYLPHCDRLFVFDAAEILLLRELLRGSFAMLELNSIIHRTIIRK